MELNSAFSVKAPMEKVWATLMDIERVAGCLPGAQVLGKLSEDAYQLGVQVKLGPVTMAYRGQLDVAERDALHHRAVLSGQAKETRGQGTARATATMTLHEADGLTNGTIHTDLALSGKAAAMGKSVIGSVSDQLMKQFAANLQAMIDEPTPDQNGAERAETAADPAAALIAATAPAMATAVAATAAADGAGTPDAAATPTQAPTPATPTAPAIAMATAEAGPSNSLNALTLVKGVVTDQLSDPKKLGALVLLVSAVAFLLGRRAGRRSV